MAFLKLNEFTVSVKADSAGQSNVEYGSFGYSYSGLPIKNVRAVKREWSLNTTLMLPADARTLIGLLLGHGHHWSFDNATYFKYSSKGLGPTTGTTAYLARQTTSIKYGTASADITANQLVQWNTNYTNDWTIMVWRKSGGNTNHYIVNSNGQKWVDGVRNDAAATAFITMSSGNVRLGDVTVGSTQQFDDLVVVPFIISPNFCEVFGVNTQAFSDLPKLNATGTLLTNDDVYVYGADVSSKFQQGTYSDGTWYDALQEVSFKLIEEDVY